MKSKGILKYIIIAAIAIFFIVQIVNIFSDDISYTNTNYSTLVETITEIDKDFEDLADDGKVEIPNVDPNGAPVIRTYPKKYITNVRLSGYNAYYTIREVKTVREDGKILYSSKECKTTLPTNTEVFANNFSAWLMGGLDTTGKAWDGLNNYGIKINGEELNITWKNADPNANSGWSSLLSTAGFLIMFIALFFIFRATRTSGTNPMDFAKVNNNMVSNTKVRFNDVAGADEEKEELKEVVDFLKAPQRYSEIGAKIPKGVLLVGPPGTGKTLFAKAVAGEAGVPFFSMSGSDFVEMFVGVGASRVRNLFTMAKKNKPCIVFIDEIDAVGRQRGTGLGGGNDEREQTLNQLLVLMDGFEANEGIIVIAATNRADVLDPALLRPGRFDRQITVNLPDVKGREEILKVHARNKPLAPDVNFKNLSRITSGFSGADLANLLNEAAILAVRNKRKVITNVDLYEGVNKVIMGPQKKSRVVTETDKRITAYHEAGHAILANILPNCDSVQEVSIIPRGNAAGYTLTRPETDDNHLTLSKLLDDITMTLGGRVAEELVIQDISAGASGDIQMVTKRARAMVTEWGMSELIGPVSYGGSQEVFLGRDYASKASYSDKMADLIDDEVERIIKERLEVARKLLKENRKILDNMARLLVERETIYGEEVTMLMEGKSVEEIMAFTDAVEQRRAKNPFAKINIEEIQQELAQKQAQEQAEQLQQQETPKNDNVGGNIE